MQSSPSQHGSGLRHVRPVWLLLATLILAACGQDTPVTTARFQAFSTSVDMSLVGVNRQQARQAAALIQEDFLFLQRDTHVWQPGPMGRLNQMLATSEPFVAPPSVMPLVRLSKIYEEQSDGLFNPAIGHLMDLWGFHAEAVRSRPPPPSPQIKRLVEAAPSLRQIDIDGLELRGHNPAIMLDFDALTKAYALDLAINHLRDLGIKSAMIQAGGEVRVIGDRAGQPWRITIRRPSGAGVLAIVPLRGDESLVTKADYDRNFVFKGEIYHAIIDPRTGSPARASRSVTVLHTDATTAAAAATALFIAGPTDWQRVATDLGISHALLVDADGAVHMNPTMAQRIELVDASAQVILAEEFGADEHPVVP
ncbi:thiamine biosynthesis protein ApbE [Thiocapsa imhoffii]|uniref:FAD:protein FMN transferase n=1 Tax=Thiocapsa imhoffii TaxID=382777 RepID=A0A9X1B8G6_9GAMM|nr:FAD:protein FMN transferase [Thiocapsa imhoffii]MBK1644223.1 thiamine biosynthesis protein ApbE [Thiocapsa imhoffii]